MNVEKRDVGKKKRGATIAAIVMIALLLLWIVVLLALQSYDPLPLVVLISMLAGPAVVILGVLLALRERMKEINKGEEDEATKY